MSTIAAKLNVSDGVNDYYIQKNSQNSLKGLLWQTGGSTLIGASLLLTIGTVVLVGTTAFSTNSLGTSLGQVIVPALIGASIAVCAVDYIAVKFTGYCFSNAIHHMGPEFEIIRQKKLN